MHTLRGAMTIDSLASATNNNFQSDPNINGTGRMDGNTATALVPSEYKPGDNALDAFRHELLLSRRSAQHHAYINVILRDSTPAFFPTGTPVATGDVVLSFGTCVLFANMTMDNIIKSYLADLGGARTELEYFLAHHQVSLYADVALNVSVVAAQVGLKNAPPGPVAANKRQRNDRFFIDGDENALGDKVINVGDVLYPLDGSNYACLRGPVVGGVGISKNKDGMTVFVPMQSANFLRDSQTKHAFKPTPTRTLPAGGCHANSAFTWLPCEPCLRAPVTRTLPREP